MTDQTPPDRPAARPLAVPSSRLARMTRLGSAATGIAGSLAVQGARAYARGERPAMQDLLLTPANLHRLTTELARMRGAAMKVGQLVSMDAGDVLPPELAQILSRLRADADYMPPAQLRRVLDGAWGPGWQKQFRKFEPRPMAAASIGQVHRATLPDGRVLAVKVQYPGIRRAIDSDVTNVGALVRVSGLVPKGMDIAPLLEEAKRQLHEEADYAREAGQLTRFAALLGETENFALPEPIGELVTSDVLPMTFLPGRPLEEMTDLPQAERDWIVERLFLLLFRELFEFRLIQSDPNFANFRYDPESRTIGLLDFGAARPVPAEVSEGYRALMAAGIWGGADEIDQAAEALGFVAPDTAPHHRAMVAGMIDTAFVPLRAATPFDFRDADLAARLRDQGMAMASDRSFTHIPPVDVLFVQRKIAGLSLLARTLGARLALRPLAEAWLDSPRMLPAAE
ncbi:MAG: AarF/ABC1/UbiB kinase family protein [Pseudomonadota bacterium]